MSQALEYQDAGDWDVLRRNLDKISKTLRQTLPQVRVVHNGVQVCGTGALVTLAFNTELYDNGEMHSVAVNNSRLTAKVAGLYAIGAQVTFDVNAAGYRYLDILHNGATIIDTTWLPPTAASTSLNAYTEFRLAPGEFVEARVVQNSGGNLNVLTAASYTPVFYMHRIGGYTNEGIA